MAELTPYPLGALAVRMFRELDVAEAIFDLPVAKFFTGDPGKDLSVQFHGRRAGSPLGPAAGPHTQIAQNIVLSWLGGCRVMELKTVQILDELEIPRPCIDMQTIGFNAEWSQELKLAQSLDEYVKASMLIEILRASGRVREVESFEPLVFDMSVGYDLAGIRSEPVLAFIRGMMDASTTVERLRADLPAEIGGLRDLDFSTRLSDSITLSTFHGCPPDEIERIIEFLLEELGIHSVIKFNPLLLGPVGTRELLNDHLGYEQLRVPDSAFEGDTKWEQAVEMMERLGDRADELGLGLGAKFSNTLITDTHRGFIPESVDEVYLSGTPLHVLAMNLVRRFRRRFGDRFAISFAAGIDRTNFADAVAMGLVPVTVCSDLLGPGGYGRLPMYQKELLCRMEAVGASRTDDFVLRAYGNAAAALDRAEPAAEGRQRCRQALDASGDLAAAAGDELFGRWVSAAILLNTEQYVATATDDARYAAARNSKPPRKIGRQLKLFDCITCDKCIPVCPNDANFSFRPPVEEIPVVKLRREGSGWRWDREDTLRLEEKHQIATFIDFCNECGNCDVFCPEDGGPYLVKPRFFGSEAVWRASSELDGFYAQRSDGGSLTLGRFEGRELRLETIGDRVHFSGEGFRVSYDAADPEGSVEAEGPDEVDLTYCHIMDALHRGVFAPDRVNYVNSLEARRSGR